MDVDIPTPLPRLTYNEAMERYGSDKPDTRFGMELQDISDSVKDSEFVVFKSALENGGSVRAIVVPGCCLGIYEKGNRQACGVCEGHRRERARVCAMGR